MSAVAGILRGSFLYLSRQGWLRRWVEQSGASRRVTSRFIAGLTVDDGLRVTGRLKEQGILTSLDFLGENVTEMAEARQARDAYLTALHRIAQDELPATVSIKVTALGLDLSTEGCLDNVDALVKLAHETGSRVEMDMESSAYTDRTLEIVTAMATRYQPDSVRAVIQAYLYRTEADIAMLCEKGIPVRLCKGAYQEPEAVAWPKKADVDASYVKQMKVLLDKGRYPAFATHDEAIIDECIRYAGERGIRPDQFEFQMLYGVRRSLQTRLVREGFRLRLYVPYGNAWYPYFMRRLAERPANVMFIARQMFG